MPIATIDPNQYERYELTTAPADPNIEGDENGYVCLRPLPFGLIQERQDKTLTMSMKGRKPQDRKRKGGEIELPDVDLKTLHKIGIEFDFAYCIGDHNLLDKSGTRIDFTNPLTFKILDPKIGQEIEKLIDELNTPEGEESAEDFIKRATSLPGNEPNSA